MAVYILWISVIFILYTYAGFPVILTLLAQIKKKPKPYPIAQPSVTLLIAAYNEEAVIANKIKNSLELDYPKDKLQILVANDCSDDSTAEIVQQYVDRGVELITGKKRRGKTNNIADATAHARGEILIISDASNLYLPDTIKELVLPFGDPTVGATSGSRYIIRGDGPLGDAEGFYWRYEGFIKKQETLLSTCTSAAGDMLAIRRELYEPPPEEIINDDFYITLQVTRKGKRLVYTPNAKTFERVSPSAQDEITRRARMVTGRFQAMALSREMLPWRWPIVVWQIISHKYLRPMVPYAMLGAFVSNLVLVVWPPQASTNRFWQLASPFCYFFFALQVIFYLLALIGNLTSSQEHNHIIRSILYLPTFLYNSNIAAVLGLVRFLRGERSNLWQRVPRRT